MLILGLGRLVAAYGNSPEKQPEVIEVLGGRTLLRHLITVREHREIGCGSLEYPDRAESEV
jgi:hypothetical protein